VKRLRALLVRACHSLSLHGAQASRAMPPCTASAVPGNAANGGRRQRLALRVTVSLPPVTVSLPAGTISRCPSPVGPATRSVVGEELR
jgi:hypothetical protein